jgi:hypothetical protein
MSASPAERQGPLTHLEVDQSTGLDRLTQGSALPRHAPEFVEQFGLMPVYTPGTTGWSDTAHDHIAAVFLAHPEYVVPVDPADEDQCEGCQ